jgi:hypothetical protein
MGQSHGRAGSLEEETAESLMCGRVLCIRILLRQSLAIITNPSEGPHSCSRSGEGESRASAVNLATRKSADEKSRSAG